VRGADAIGLTAFAFPDLIEGFGDEGEEFAVIVLEE
jgi:hypothetical protein